MFLLKKKRKTKIFLVSMLLLITFILPICLGRMNSSAEIITTKNTTVNYNVKYERSEIPKNSLLILGDQVFRVLDNETASDGKTPGLFLIKEYLDESSLKSDYAKYSNATTETFTINDVDFTKNIQNAYNTMNNLTDSQRKNVYTGTNANFVNRMGKFKYDYFVPNPYFNYQTRGMDGTQALQLWKTQRIWFDTQPDSPNYYKRIKIQTKGLSGEVVGQYNPYEIQDDTAIINFRGNEVKNDFLGSDGLGVQEQWYGFTPKPSVMSWYPSGGYLEKADVTLGEGYIMRILKDNLKLMENSATTKITDPNQISKFFGNNVAVVFYNSDKYTKWSFNQLGEQFRKLAVRFDRQEDENMKVLSDAIKPVAIAFYVQNGSYPSRKVTSEGFSKNEYKHSNEQDIINKWYNEKMRAFDSVILKTTKQTSLDEADIKDKTDIKGILNNYGRRGYDGSQLVNALPRNLDSSTIENAKAFPISKEELEKYMPAVNSRKAYVESTSSLGSYFTRTGDRTSYQYVTNESDKEPVAIKTSDGKDIFVMYGDTSTLSQLYKHQFKIDVKESHISGDEVYNVTSDGSVESVQTNTQSYSRPCINIDASKLESFVFYGTSRSGVYALDIAQESGKLVDSYKLLKTGDKLLMDNYRFEILDTKTNMGTEGIFVASEYALSSSDLVNVQFNSDNSYSSGESGVRKRTSDGRLFNDYQGSQVQKRLQNLYATDFQQYFGEYILDTTLQDEAYAISSTRSVVSNAYSSYSSIEANSQYYKGTTLNKDKMFPLSVKELITYKSTFASRVYYYNSTDKTPKYGILRSPLSRKNNAVDAIDIGSTVAVVNQDGKIASNNASNQKSNSNYTYSLKPAMNLDLTNAIIVTTSTPNVYRVLRNTGYVARFFDNDNNEISLLRQPVNDPSEVNFSKYFDNQFAWYGVNRKTNSKYVDFSSERVSYSDKVWDGNPLVVTITGKAKNGTEIKYQYKKKSEDESAYIDGLPVESGEYSIRLVDLGKDYIHFIGNEGEVLIDYAYLSADVLKNDDNLKIAHDEFIVLDSKNTVTGGTGTLVASKYAQVADPVPFEDGTKRESSSTDISKYEGSSIQNLINNAYTYRYKSQVSSFAISTTIQSSNMDSYTKITDSYKNIYTNQGITSSTVPFLLSAGEIEKYHNSNNSLKVLKDNQWDENSVAQWTRSDVLSYTAAIDETKYYPLAFNAYGNMFLGTNQGLATSNVINSSANFRIAMNLNLSSQTVKRLDSNHYILMTEDFDDREENLKNRKLDTSPTIATYDKKSKTIYPSIVVGGATNKAYSYTSSLTGSFSTTKPTQTDPGIKIVYIKYSYKYNGTTYNSYRYSYIRVNKIDANSLQVEEYQDAIEYDGKGHKLKYALKSEWMSDTDLGRCFSFRLKGNSGLYRNDDEYLTQVEPGEYVYEYMISDGNNKYQGYKKGELILKINKSGKSPNVNAKNTKVMYDGLPHSVDLDIEFSDSSYITSKKVDFSEIQDNDYLYIAGRKYTVLDADTSNTGEKGISFIRSTYVYDKKSPFTNYTSNSSFVGGRRPSDEEYGNQYRGSILEKNVNAIYLDELLPYKDAIQETYKRDAAFTLDSSLYTGGSSKTFAFENNPNSYTTYYGAVLSNVKLFVLSVEEAYNYLRDTNGKFIPDITSSGTKVKTWLRSPADSAVANNMYRVNANMELDGRIYIYQDQTELNYNPAMNIDLSKVDIYKTEKTGEYYVQPKLKSEILYKQSDGQYSSDIPEYTQPGIYNIEYMINSNCYETYKDSYSLEIEKPLLNENMVRISETRFPYDGNNKSATVYYDGLEEGKYTVKYSVNGATYTTTPPVIKDVGEKDVDYIIVTDDYQDYKGSFTLEVYSTKILYNKTDLVFTYTGSAKSVSSQVKVTDPPSGYTIKYKTSASGTYSTTVPSFTNVSQSGTTVYFLISAPERNDEEGSFKVTINKATMPGITITNNTHNYDGTAKKATITKTALAANKAQVIKFGETQGSYTTTEPTATNVSDTRTIYYEVSDAAGNYTTLTGSYKLTINPIQITQPTFTENSHVFDGKSHFATPNFPTLLGSSKPKIKYGIKSGEYNYEIIPDNIKKGSEIEFKENNGVTINDGSTITIAGVLYDVVDPSKTNTGDTNGMFLIARKLTSYGMPPIVEQGETYDKTGNRPDGRLANDYQGSNLQKVIKNDFESNYKDKYGKYILPTSKVDSVFTSTKSKSYGNNAFVYHMNTNPDVGATLDGDYIFAPSAEEVDKYLTSDSNSLITKYAQNDSNVKNYWYRSPYVGSSSGEKTFGHTNVNKFHWQTSPQGQYSRRTLLCMNVNLDEAYLLQTGENEYTLLTEEDEEHYDSIPELPSIVNVNDSKEIYYQLADDLGNYTPVTGSFNVEITKADFPEAIITDTEQNYNGTPRYANISVPLADGSEPLIKYSTEDANYGNHPECIAPGTYTIYYDLTDPNYNYEHGKWYKLTIKKGIIPDVEDDQGIGVVASGYSGKYDGQMHYGTVTLGTGMTSGYNVYYKDKEEGDYTSTQPIGIKNVGTKKVWYKVTYPNYEPKEGFFTLEVTKAEIDYTVTGYDGINTGSAHGLVINVKKPTNAVIKYGYTEDDINLNYSPSYTEQGAYPIWYTITDPEGNYEDIKAVEYIRIASNPITFTVEGYSGEYDGVEHGAIININTPGLSSSNVTIRYGTDQNNINLTGSPKYKDVGSHYIYVKLSAPGYDTMTGVCLIDIKKAQIQVDLPSPNEVDYTSSQIDAGVIVKNVPQGTYTIAYTVNGNSRNNAMVTDAGDYIISYEIDAGANFYSKSGTYTFKVNEVEIPTSVEGYNITATGYKGGYDGQMHYGDVILGSKLYGAQVTYSNTKDGVYSSEKIGLQNVGKVDVWYMVVKAGYIPKKGSFTLEVTKANINVIEPNNPTYLFTGSSIVSPIVVEGLSQNEYVVSYRLSTSAIFNQEFPQIIYPGKYDIYYKVNAGNNYYEKTGNYSITINPIDFPSYDANFLIEGNGYDGTYDGEVHYGTVNLGNSLKGVATVEYSEFNNGQYSSSNVGIKDYGNKTVYYKVSAPGYNPKYGQFNLNVRKAKILWSRPEKLSVEYTGDYIDAGITVTNVPESEYTIVYTIDNNQQYSAYVRDIKSYLINFRIDAGDNYNVEQGSYLFEIKKASIDTETPGYSVEASGYSGTYDKNPHSGKVELGQSLVEKGAVVSYSRDKNGTYSTNEIYITDVGKFDVWYKVELDGYTPISGSFTLEVTKANITPIEPVFANTTVGYNDNGYSAKVYAEELSENDYTVLYRVGFTGSYSTQVPTLRDVNSYLVQYKINAGTNYNEYEGSYTLIIETADLPSNDPDYMVTASGYDGVYDKNEHFGNVELGKAIRDKAVVEYASYANGPYSSAPIGITNYGSKTVHYKVTITGYNTIQSSYTLNVRKAQIEVQEPQNLNVHYAGIAVNAGVTVKNIDPGQYTITYTVNGTPTDNISLNDPGQYLIVYSINAGDNYEPREGTYVFNISTSAIPTDNPNYSIIPTGYSGTYDGQAHFGSVKLGESLVANNAVITYSDTKTGTYSQDNIGITDVGEKQVWYKVSLNNFDPAIGSFDLKVTKATLSAVLPDFANGAVYYSEDGYNGAVSVNTYNNTPYQVRYKVGNGSYSTNAPILKDPGNYIVYYEVDAGLNYEILNGSYTLRIDTSDLPTTDPRYKVSVNNVDVIYNGSEQFGIIELGDAIKDKATIEYSENGVNYSNTPIGATDAGQKTIYYRVKVPGFNTKSGSFTINIRKADIDVTIPLVRTVNYTGNYIDAGVTVNNVVGNYTVIYVIDGKYKTNANLRDVNVYNISYTVDANKNYNQATGQYLFIIDLATFPQDDPDYKITASGYTGSYDKQSHRGTVTLGNKLISEGAYITYSREKTGTYSSEPIEIKDAGRFTVWYKVSLTGYEDYIGSYILEVTKANIIVQLPTYANSEVDYTQSGYSTKVMVTNLSSLEYIDKYRLGPVGDINLSAMNLTEPGDYLIYYNINAGTNYNEITDYYTLSIRTKDFPTNDPSYSITPVGYNGPYDKTEHKGSVTLGSSLAGRATIDYSTSSINGPWSSSQYGRTNQGITTIYYRVSLDGYNPKVGTITINISRANIEVVEPINNVVSYTGKDINAGITVSNLNPGEYSIVYSIDGTQVPNATLKDPGKYEIEYSVKAGDNYNEKTGKYIFEISESAIPTDDPNYAINPIGYEGKYDKQTHIGRVEIGPELVAKKAVVSYSRERNGVYSTTPIGIKDVGEIEVWYKVEVEGYTTVINKFMLKVTPEDIDYTLPEIANTSKVYTSNAFDGLITVNNLNYGEYSILYRLGTTGSYTSVAPTFKDTGSYIVYYKIDAGTNYNLVDSSYTFNIITLDFPENDPDYAITYSGYEGVYDNNNHYGSVTLGSKLQDAVIEYAETSSGPWSRNNIPIKDYGQKVVYFRVSLTGYNSKVNAFTLSVLKKKIEVTEPENKVVYYTGSNFDVRVIPNNVNVSDCTILYRVDGNGSYTPNIPANIINAKTYLIEYMVSAGTNYEDVSGSFTFEVKTIDIPVGTAGYEINATGYQGTYDKTMHTGTINKGSKLLGATIEYAETRDGVYSTNEIWITDVGEKTVWYRVSIPNFNPYISSYTLKVNPAVMKVNVQGYQGKYDGNEHYITVNPVDPPDAEVKYGSRQDDINSMYQPVMVNVGTYPVYYKVTHPNYLDVQGVEYVVITNFESIKFTAVGYNGEYDGNEHGANVTINSTEIPKSSITIKYKERPEDDYTLTTSPTYTNVGEYTVYIKIEAPGYDTLYPEVSIIIKKADILLSSADRAIQYDGEEHDAGIEIERPSSSICTVKYRYDGASEYTTKVPKYKNVGSYEIEYIIEANDNYVRKEGKYTFTINKASLTGDEQENLLSVVGYDGVYDGSEHSGLIVVSEKVEGSVIYYSTASINGPWQTENPSYTNVTEKEVFFKVTSENYLDEVGSFIIKIKPATMKYEVDSYSGPYDGNEHGITITMINPKEAVIKYGLTADSIALDTSPTFKDADVHPVYYTITAKNYEPVVANVAFVKISNDLLYSAIFEQYNGSTDRQDAVVNEDAIIYPSAEAVSGYTFIGWLGDASRITVEDVVFKAIYVKTNTDVMIKNAIYIDTNYDGDNMVVSYRQVNDSDYKDGLPNQVGQYKVRVRIDEPGKWNNGAVNLNISVQKYTATFKNISGGTFFELKNLLYKSDIPNVQAPIVENYVFIKWYGFELLKDELECDIMFIPIYMEKAPEEKDVNDGLELETNIEGAELTYVYVNKETGEKFDNIPPDKPGLYDVYVKGEGWVQDPETGELIYDELFDEMITIKYKNQNQGVIPNIPIYRLYNRTSGEHLFTTKLGEYNKLGENGWIKEGVAFDAYAEDNKPDDAVAVYRLYNKEGLGGLGDHHYTKSKNEVNKLVSAGWSLDFLGEPAFYVAGKIPVYKMYNPSNGAHHYTPKTGERDKMTKIGWINEGIGWYVNAYYNSDGSRVSDKDL